MPKEFIGYTVAPGWKKLTLFRFDAKTHARMSVEEIKPFAAFSMDQKKITVLERLQGLNVPLPSAGFKP